MTTHSASSRATPPLKRQALRAGSRVLSIKLTAPSPLASLVRWHRERTRLLRVADLTDPSLFDGFLKRAIGGVSRSYAAASISVEVVPLHRIQPLSRVAEIERYETARRLVRLMKRRRYQLFEPALLRYRGEHSYRLVMPPVVEETEEGLVVVDGVHRLAALADRRTPPQEVQVVVVRRPRPSRSWAVPADLSVVQVRDDDLPRQRKFRHLKEERFRPTGKVLRSGRFRFDSPERFVATCDRVARTNRVIGRRASFPK